MAKKPIKPFKNESDCLQIDDLTIENRIDRVSLFGSIDITRDKNGLALARQLREILELTLHELEGVELPDRITLEAGKSVKNPFT
ncbi:MAG: hypothetical protein HXX11_07080 [Desulfuromonadales bacterium]|nr:hypothetical protein [Desulfuromonadales bacterium]